MDDDDENESKSDISETTILNYENNMRKLKDITGIPDMNGVVSRCQSQMDVKYRLILLINAIEAKINQHRQERTKQSEELSCLKTSLESKGTK